METSRRDFIKSTAIIAAGAALIPKDIFASPKKIERLGVQLYSVRDAMKVDAKGSLKKLANMGYIHVESAIQLDRNYYGYSPKEFKKILNDLDMQIPSGHVYLKLDEWDAAKKDFTDKWKYTIEDAVTVGQRYMINPWIDEDVRKDTDKLKRFVELINKSAELCAKSGIKFGYHNENYEFGIKVDDTNLFEYILRQTDANLVAMQIDIGNMYGHGGDALALIKKYPNRFELMHVKDEIKATTSNAIDPYESTLLGQGLIPVKDIIKAARKIGGTSQFIIEQEDYQAKDPFDCMKTDLDMMKRCGF